MFKAQAVAKRAAEKILITLMNLWFNHEVLSCHNVCFAFSGLWYNNILILHSMLYAGTGRRTDGEGKREGGER